MIILIGIDDTDNLESRGTGYRARCLGKELQDKGFGTMRGVTRHQLYVNELIPYTSHNSSLCIKFDASTGDLAGLIDFCKGYMKISCAEGSDPGLCVCELSKIPEEVMEFGRNAKKTVLTKKDAEELSLKYNIHLSEHGGTGGGVIGSLAAIGLRAWGNDGRFVWLRGTREITGIISVNEIAKQTDVECIVGTSGETLNEEDLVDVGDWFRPVMLNGKATLIVQPNDDAKARWKILDREKIKEKY